MLIDDVTLTIKAGDGGDGAVAFHPMRGGPSGGNGGNGADIYLIGINDIDGLSQFRFKKNIEAESGTPGGKKDKDGKNAVDLYIKVPVGTRISINDSGWIYEISDTVTPFLLARGGRGGRGNDEFKSSTNQTPRFAEKGEAGQVKKVRLQMRLIADIGLVGLPNAGKSSLLQTLTNAKPKIGNYPFTTLEANLGVMDNLIIADVPGLIEGASSGRGLGIKFLKHIEKTKIIAHCLDITSEDIEEDYATIREEFKNYNLALLNKKEILVLTKADLVEEREIKSKINLAKKLNTNTIAVSIIDNLSLMRFEEFIKKQVERHD